MAIQVWIAKIAQNRNKLARVSIVQDHAFMLEDGMISHVMHLHSSSEEDFHQYIPKKEPLNLLVNLVWQ